MVPPARRPRGRRSRGASTARRTIGRPAHDLLLLTPLPLTPLLVRATSREIAARALRWQVRDGSRRLTHGGLRAALSIGTDPAGRSIATVANTGGRRRGLPIVGLAMASRIRFVTVATMSDAIQAQMACDLLAEEGIAATAVGKEHGAMLGVYGAFLQIPLQVPADRAAEARELLTQSGLLGPTPDGGDKPKSAGRGHLRSVPTLGAKQAVTTAGSPRQKRVAIFVAVALSFGAGHFYAREHVSGALLGIAELALIVLAVAGDAAVMGGVPLLMLVDLIGSLYAVRRYNDGRPRSTDRQLVITGGLVALVVVAAVYALPAIGARLPQDDQGQPLY